MEAPTMAPTFAPPLSSSIMMLSIRSTAALRRVLAARTRTTTAIRTFAAAAKPVSVDDDDEDGPRFSPVQVKASEMKKADPYMVFGDTEDLPAPVLPENPAEISALDPAQARHYNLPDGTSRIVTIRQGFASPMQSPRNKENDWCISFQDEGETANTWTNPLMGWVSGADPQASHLHSQVTFPTAAEAVYFAKKRGWNFIVEKPKLRAIRRDGAQYQDNFLPQNVADEVARERTQTKQWERPKACTSHYMRPLKYHGDGTCPQYGPNPDAPTMKHVESIYKMR